MRDLAHACGTTATPVRCQPCQPSEKHAINSVCTRCGASGSAAESAGPLTYRQGAAAQILPSWLTQAAISDEGDRARRRGDGRRRPRRAARPRRRLLAVAGAGARRGGPPPAARQRACGVGSLDALLALQGATDPLERRRRAVRPGGPLLDVLDELKLACSTAAARPAALERPAPRRARRAARRDRRPGPGSGAGRDRNPRRGRAGQAGDGRVAGGLKRRDLEPPSVTRASIERLDERGYKRRALIGGAVYASVRASNEGGRVSR